MNAPDRYEPHIPQSTIEAAVYLIRSAPERLKDWLARHYPHGAAIERKAREQIARRRNSA